MVIWREREEARKQTGRGHILRIGNAAEWNAKTKSIQLAVNHLVGIVRRGPQLALHVGIG